MKTPLLFLSLLTLIASTALGAPAKANIIVILADDLGERGRKGVSLVVR